MPSKKKTTATAEPSNPVEAILAPYKDQIATAERFVASANKLLEAFAGVNPPAGVTIGITEARDWAFSRTGDVAKVRLGAAIADTLDEMF